MPAAIALTADTSVADVGGGGSGGGVRGEDESDVSHLMPESQRLQRSVRRMVQAQEEMRKKHHPGVCLCANVLMCLCV